MSKKLISLAIVVIAILSMTSTAAATVADIDDCIIKVTAQALYVKTGPGTSPALGWLATVNQGDEMKLLAYSSDRNYCYVETRDKTRGWVTTKFTNATMEEEIVESDLPVPIIVEDDEVCRIAVNTALRADASNDAEVELRITTGNKVTVEETLTDSDGEQWCYIHYQSWKHGWVKLAELDKMGVYGELRNVNRNADSGAPSTNTSVNTGGNENYTPNYSQKKVGETYRVISSGLNVRRWKEGCEDSNYLNDRTTEVICTISHGTEVKVTGMKGNILYIVLPDGTSGIIDGTFVG